MHLYLQVPAADFQKRFQMINSISSKMSTTITPSYPLRLTPPPTIVHGIIMGQVALSSKIRDSLVGWFINQKLASMSTFNKLWGVIDSNIPAGTYNLFIENSKFIRLRPIIVSGNKTIDHGR